MVSWSNAAAASAAGYMVQATSTDGHNSSCEDMGTSCHIDSLVCGQEYSIVVEAVHDGCPGPAGTPVMLSTGGCNVMVSCQNHRGGHRLLKGKYLQTPAITFTLVYFFSDLPSSSIGLFLLEHFCD